MKKNSFLVLLVMATGLLCMGFSSVHEYYISITSIDYNNESQSLEISQQYIAHDVEEAVLRKYKVNLHLAEPNEHPKADSLLYVYVMDNFELNTDTAVKLNWIGREVNLDETLLIYLQSETMKKPQELEVKNTTLTEVFPAQSNITHVNFGKKQLTKSLNILSTSYTFITQ